MLPETEDTHPSIVPGPNSTELGMFAQVGGTPPGTTTSWVCLSLFFLKISLVLYGSGYVLLAFLQRDLLERHQ